MPKKKLDATHKIMNNHKKLDTIYKTNYEKFLFFRHAFVYYQQ
jgi:hypothetical protein